MKKASALLLAALLAMSALSGCASSGSSDVITIGVFEPLTGDNAAGGELEVAGIELANELYPEVLGKKVVLVKVDNKSDKAEAATAAARLVEQNKVQAIIGSWGSSLSMAAGNIVMDAKIPAVGASCTNPLVTLNNDYYFRVCFIDPFQGTVMANYATSKLGAKTAAIIQEVSNDYSVGLASFFEDSFTKTTGDASSIVEKGNYQTGDKDFTAILTNIKQKNPDVIFAPGNFTESALIIKQARQLGITTPFLGGDTWETPDFLSVGGAEVEGAVFSTFFDKAMVTTSEATKFLAEFEKKNPGVEPAAVTALGYDAYILILDAIKRANSTDGPAIRDALASTSGFQAVTGSTTLDANGDAVKDAVIKSVTGGKFTYLDYVKAQ
ncbi:MAG: ABC transporter substrate-binding protein [Clostridiales bacterium]|nr:ABC transporter substrate-binding protein [Clostridiales bacterium]MDR2752332.1 ABC transporter substrate-binding protein [Clostridiales bacterium]